jgi:hypothetical protein
LDIFIHLERDHDDEYWEDFLLQTHKIFRLISWWWSLHFFNSIEGDIHTVLHPLRVIAVPMLEVFKVEFTPSWEEPDDDYEPFILFYFKVALPGWLILTSIFQSQLVSLPYHLSFPSTFVIIIICMTSTNIAASRLPLII